MVVSPVCLKSVFLTLAAVAISASMYFIYKRCRMDWAVLERLRGPATTVVVSPEPPVARGVLVLDSILDSQVPRVRALPPRDERDIL